MNYGKILKTRIRRGTEVKEAEDCTGLDQLKRATGLDVGNMCTAGDIDSEAYTEIYDMIMDRLDQAYQLGKASKCTCGHKGPTEY